MSFVTIPPTTDKVILRRWQMARRLAAILIAMLFTSVSLRAQSAALYDVERQIGFNVLDRLEYNPVTGQIALVGHSDSRYKTPPIPYVQHLATLLESSGPEFSLNWTRESETAVDAWLSRLDSDRGWEEIERGWRMILDGDGKVTATGRLLLPILGVQPTGSSWDAIDQFAVLTSILRAAGNVRAGDALKAYGQMQAAGGGRDPDGFRNGYYLLVFAGGKGDAFQEVQRRAISGALSRPEAEQQLFRLTAESFDASLGLVGNPAVNAYDSARRRGIAPQEALDKAVIPEINRQLPNILRPALESALHRLDEYVMPPEVLASTANVKPEVVPEFLDVDSHSQLARLLFEADYLTKFLVSRPELRNNIPRYRTLFGFERENPVKTPFRGVASCRIWITVDNVDAAQSADGRVLATRAANLRFNIRDKSSASNPSAECSPDYARLLTSLYDDLAVEYPVLHELREATKLAAAARWLRDRRPGMTLPKVGGAGWNAPNKVAGLIYVMWSPVPPRPGAPAVSVRVEGGISLRLPATAILQDQRLAIESAASPAPQQSKVVLALSGSANARPTPIPPEPPPTLPALNKEPDVPKAPPIVPLLGQPTAEARRDKASVQARVGIVKNSANALTFEGGGLSTFEALVKPYPCEIVFNISYTGEKVQGTGGDVDSVTNDSGTSTLIVHGRALFTPGFGDAHVGTNHWSILSTTVNLRQGGLLKLLCPDSRFGQREDGADSTAGWSSLSKECQTGLSTAMTGANTVRNNRSRLAALDRATHAQGMLQKAVAGTNIPWQMLAAIGIRESGFGETLIQPKGKGRGIFQIDLGENPEVKEAQALDPVWSAHWAAQRLAADYVELATDYPNLKPAELFKATAASYNFGTGNISGEPDTIDQGTTGNNYGTNIQDLAGGCFVQPKVPKPN